MVQPASWVVLVVIPVRTDSQVILLCAAVRLCLAGVPVRATQGYRRAIVRPHPIPFAVLVRASDPGAYITHGGIIFYVPVDDVVEVPFQHSESTTQRLTKGERVLPSVQTGDEKEALGHNPAFTIVGEGCRTWILC